MYERLIITAVGKARQEAILREAECDRLLQESGVTRSGVQERLLTNLGNLLISTGEKLQDRYPPVASHGSNAYQSR